MNLSSQTRRLLIKELAPLVISGKFTCYDIAEIMSTEAWQQLVRKNSMFAKSYAEDFKIREKVKYSKNLRILELMIENYVLNFKYKKEIEKLKFDLAIAENQSEGWRMVKHLQEKLTIAENQDVILDSSTQKL